MAEITAAAVKSLRDRTGAGMMDCKKALAEADGDEERALDLLRQRGAARAARRAGREASEGTVKIASADGRTAMVEVLTETDFVARSDAFEAFADELAERLLELPVAEGEVVAGETLFAVEGGEDLEAALDELRLQVGENVQLGRVVRFDAADGAGVASYVHFGNRIGVLVEVSRSDEEAMETGRGVAMHTAATNPQGLSPDDIPEDVVQRERTIYEEQAREEGKPSQIIEKIVEGRIRKFFEENALLWQGYVRDPDVKIKDLLAQAGGELEVKRFVRFEVGG